MGSTFDSKWRSAILVDKGVPKILRSALFSNLSRWLLLALDIKGHHAGAVQSRIPLMWETHIFLNDNYEGPK